MPTIDYVLADGTKVKGVTTILSNVSYGSMDPLIAWGVKLAREGKDFREERRKAADLGTLLHGVVENYPNPPAEDVYRSDHQRALAVYENHARWLANNKAEVILQEKNLVSEKLRFGGCPDLVFTVGTNGKRYLGDVKTGKSWGGEKSIAQMAAYGYLLAEHGIPVESAVILHHTPDHKLRVIEITQEMMASGFEVFKKALELDALLPKIRTRSQGTLA